MSSAFSLDTQVDLKTSLPTRVEELPEGSYSGQITKAGIKNIETKNGPATLFEISIAINDATMKGMRVIYTITYWLTSEPNLRRCLTGLKRLGFECDQWGPAHGRPYTVELEAAAEKMAGCILQFKRGTSSNGYATIGLESLDESNKGQDPVSDADLPF